MIGTQNQKFAENEVVFREGDQGDCAYLIEYGQVLVYLEKDGVEIPLKFLGKGEIFGEMSMIDNSLRSASCRALCETRLVIVTQEQLLDRIQSADPVVRLLMRALLERLRDQNFSLKGVQTEMNPIISEKLAMEKQEAIERIELENRMSLGLKNDEFSPHYQPIYDLEQNIVIGAEALIRWKTADGNTISPGVFVDVLEQSSLILSVGQMMIEKCVSDLVQLQKSCELSKDFFTSINISGRQFADPQFLDHLEIVRARAGIPAHQIKLEVTERIMTEGPQAIATLQNCRSFGYRIAIDDFGTGFSSLQYLASMPLHDLKIDRSFVNQMMTQEKSLSVVKTLIYMARLLKLNLIAEGIETNQQLLLLRNLGVKAGQGFLFSKAMPVGDLAAFLSSQAAKKAA
jgi:sensor c-di-GMP phosphodiesterase-like protein